MNIDLDGRVAVVTGAASGIGKAIAETLAASGARVAIADLNSAAAKEVAEGIDPTGAAVLGFALDVTDRAGIEALGFDERFLRIWRLCLCYSEAAFLERHVSDVQVVLAKPGWEAPLMLRG